MNPEIQSTQGPIGAKRREGTGPAPSQYQYAGWVIASLVEAGVDVHVTSPSQYYFMLQIADGLTLFVYTRSRKVMVQGRVYGSDGRDTLELLRGILPPATIWQVHSN